MLYETQFLPGSGHIDTAIWMHYMDANKTTGEEARWQLHKNAAWNPEQVLAATPHKTPTVRPPAPYHENYFGGARGVVVIAVGNEHGHTSSNPGRDWLHFT